MQRNPLGQIDQLIKTHACFTKAAPDEVKKGIYCFAISYSLISDSTLREHGVDLENCQRIEQGCNNILIIYNRKVTAKDNYIPTNDRPTSTATSSFFSAPKKLPEEKAVSNSIQIFPFREGWTKEPEL